MGPYSNISGNQPLVEDKNCSLLPRFLICPPKDETVSRAQRPFKLTFFQSEKKYETEI